METAIGVILFVLIACVVGWRIYSRKRPERAAELQQEVGQKLDEIKAKIKH